MRKDLKRHLPTAHSDIPRITRSMREALEQCNLSRFHWKLTKLSVCEESSTHSITQGAYFGLSAIAPCLPHWNRRIAGSFASTSVALGYLPFALRSVLATHHSAARITSPYMTRLNTSRWRDLEERLRSIECRHLLDSLRARARSILVFGRVHEISGGAP